MKKLSLLGCIALLIAGCKGCGDNPQQGTARTTSEEYFKHTKTLNGVEQAKVPNLIKLFKDDMANPKPDVQNFFISREMLSKIVALLEYEKNNTLPGKDSTDGLRIYFAKSAKGAKASLLLVSTHTFKPTTAQQYKTHDDYYDHSSALADDLFKNVSDLSIPAYDDQRPGARIYKPSNTIEPPCNTAGSHYITRTVAEDMVARFKGQPINTYAEWFDINFLSGLLKDPKCTGIRIYLGRHDEKHIKYPNQVAFVLIPTHLINNVDEDNFDCDILKDFYKSDKSADKINPYDNGELCPTNCN